MAAQRRLYVIKRHLHGRWRETGDTSFDWLEIEDTSFDLRKIEDKSFASREREGNSFDWQEIEDKSVAEDDSWGEKKGVGGVVAASYTPCLPPLSLGQVPMRLPLALAAPSFCIPPPPPGTMHSFGIPHHLPYLPRGQLSQPLLQPWAQHWRAYPRWQSPQQPTRHDVTLPDVTDHTPPANLMGHHSHDSAVMRHSGPFVRTPPSPSEVVPVQPECEEARQQLEAANSDMISECHGSRNAVLDALERIHASVGYKSARRRFALARHQQEANLQYRLNGTMTSGSDNFAIVPIKNTPEYSFWKKQTQMESMKAQLVGLHKQDHAFHRLDAITAHILMDPSLIGKW
jgi:hypothetical protein